MKTPKRDMNDIKVLITRPKHQAGDLRTALEKEGVSTTLFPLIQIQKIDETNAAFPAIKQKVMDLDLFQHVIFVSQNAAQLALEQIDQYWPQLPVEIQWLAIGKQTATLLSNYGIDAYHSSLGYDSEALLSSPTLQKINGDKVLIFRGEGGREKLAEELRARGAEVSYAELYRRNVPNYCDSEIEQALYQPPADIILISSGEGLQNLLQLAGGSLKKFSIDSLLNCQIIVPSQRIKIQAEQAGFKRITIASGPDNQAMTQALRQLQTSVEIDR